MTDIQEVYISLLDYLGDYTLIPVVLTAVGTCTAFIALVCLAFSPFYRKGKAAGLKTFNGILSPIVLALSVILVIAFIGSAALLFVGAGGSENSYHLIHPLSDTYYSLVAVPICFGVPVTILEEATVAVIGYTMLFYLVVLLVPAVLGFVAFKVARSSIKKYKLVVANAAEKSEQEQNEEPAEHQYMQYPVHSESEIPMEQPLADEQPKSVEQPIEQPAPIEQTASTERPEPVEQPTPAQSPEPDIPAFCVMCGTPLNGNAFCTKCGHKAGNAPIAFCTRCGSMINDGSGICPNCGNGK